MDARGCRLSVVLSLFVSVKSSGWASEIYVTVGQKLLKTFLGSLQKRKRASGLLGLKRNPPSLITAALPLLHVYRALLKQSFSFGHADTRPTVCRVSDTTRTFRIKRINVGNSRPFHPLTLRLPATLNCADGRKTSTVTAGKNIRDRI